jgi:hypothetical protein
LETRQQPDRSQADPVRFMRNALVYTFYGLAALILFLGLSAIAVMPVDIFPEINIPVVTVIWQYTGLSTPEMEERVTTYSQYAISTSVSGIKNMEAQTLNGIGRPRRAKPLLSRMRTEKKADWLDGEDHA